MIKKYTKAKVFLEANTPENPLTLAITYNDQVVYHDKVDQANSTIEFDVCVDNKIIIEISMNGKNNSHTNNADSSKHANIKIVSVEIDDMILFSPHCIKKTINESDTFKDVLAVNGDVCNITIEKPFYFWILENIGHQKK